MAENRFVHVLILQIALQIALDHVVFFAYRTGANAIFANLRTRIASAQIWLEEFATVSWTKRISSSTFDVVKTLTTLHAYCVRWRMGAGVSVAARTLTGRTFGMRFETTLFGRVFAGIVAAGLFAVFSIAAVALLASFDDSVTA